MTRFQPFILMIFLFFSCAKHEKEVINDLLIFGYSGFCFKDSVNRIYYSDEVFYNDSVKLEYDSTRLDIRQYLEFKKDSSINIAIRRPRQNIDYLSLNSFDTLGFNKLVNRCLINIDYNINYCFFDTIPRIYDGWYYSLFFKTSKNRSFKINYIPDCLPDSLNLLHDYMQKLLDKGLSNSISRFEFNQITKLEAKRLFKNHPPPNFDNTKRIKFEAH